MKSKNNTYIIITLTICFGLVLFFAKEINMPSRDFFQEVNDSSMLTVNDWTIVGNKIEGVYRMSPVYRFAIEFKSIDEIDTNLFVCFLDSSIYILSLKNKYLNYKTYSVKDRIKLNAKIGEEYLVSKGKCIKRRLINVTSLENERIMIFMGDWDISCKPPIFFDGTNCPQILHFWDIVAISDKKGIVGKAYYEKLDSSIIIKCIAGNEFFKDQVFKIGKYLPIK